LIENPPPQFCAENVHLVCIFPFSYESFAEKSRAIDGLKDFFTAPSPYSEKIISCRRQTFSPEFEWREPVRFLSIDLPVLAICCKGVAHKCIHSDFLLTIYPELFCTIQMHIELEEPILGAPDTIELIKYFRESSQDNDYEWIKCEFKSGIVQFPNFHALALFIRERFVDAYYLDPKIESSASFVFPIFYCGLVRGCRNADEIIERYRTEISGILNLWSKNFDLQSSSEIATRTSKNFHPLIYGATYISSAGLFEFHPENVAEIASREKVSVHDHHLQEICYSAAICEIAMAQYFALRICNDVLDNKFSNTKISSIYLFNPFLSLWSALAVLKFERHITILLSSIRSLGITRKPYTREILKYLGEQFDTASLQDRVAQKVVGINRILTSMFQSIIATTALMVAIAATILTIWQIVGVGGDKPLSNVNTAPAQAGQTSQPRR
jgi:hypothetical protein